MGFATAAFAFIIGLFFAIPAFIRILISALFNPRILRRVERKVAPSCLTDPSFGEHHFLRTASHLRFHYVAKGDPNKPLMLCLHGFPEFWYSWRHQLKGLSDKHRVVAVDLRGYGESDCPKGKGNYKLSYLARDIKEIVDALGYSSCILVAHDWGGAIAWNVTYLYPEIIDRLVILNAPHSASFQKYVREHWSQLKKSWYIFLFQVPFVPEMILQADDMKILATIFKKDIKKADVFTDEDLEAYKYTFGKPGSFTPPLNYYRNAFNKDIPGKVFKKKVTAPVLVIWGTADVALERGLVDGLDSYVDNLTIRFIEGASHWVQQEEPALVNSYIHQFLDN